MGFSGRVEPLLLRLATTVFPSWLFAPRLSVFLFALRTTFASLLALAIAFYEEFDEPQWAAMTVWIVAQGTRGESISKGRWRVVGTIVGAAAAVALVAFVPQQAWLFFPLLACWVGLCTALGTLVHNFRSYAFVLSAYTCAIVAISAIGASDHVFDIAIARGTTIFLGVICEMVVAMVCVPNASTQARAAIRAQLRDIISQAASITRDILHGHTPAENGLRDIFSRAVLLNDRMEFSAIEVGPQEPLLRNARNVLAQVTRLVSRALGMRSRLMALPEEATRGEAGRIVDGIDHILERLPETLATDDEHGALVLKTSTETLSHQCESAIAAALARRQDGPADATDVGLSPAMRDMVLLQGAALILTELSRLLECYDGATPLYRVKPLTRPADWRSAVTNGVRACVALLTAALFWVATAWPDGSLFVTFVAVVCARFASFGNTVLASRSFFFGAVWAVLASIVPVFGIMPITSGYPVLCMAMGLPMLIGGLATGNPATAPIAASFSNFFPYMVKPDNFFRQDEVQWLNTGMALLMGLGLGVLMFRWVLPFSMSSFSAIFRASLAKGLRRIGRNDGREPEEVWVGRVIQDMEKMLAHRTSRTATFVDAWLHGAFSVMTVGRNLLSLQTLSRPLTSEARQAIQTLFRALLARPLKGHGFHDAAHDVLMILIKQERSTTDARQRRLLMSAIGHTLIVATELSRKNIVLDEGAMRGLVPSS